MYKLTAGNTVIDLSYGDGKSRFVPIEAPEYKQFLLNGGIPEPEFTQQELITKAISHFEGVTDAFIQNKIDAHNTLNGVKFKDIDSFPKYAMNTASAHHAIANKFIAYADNIWKAVRTYFLSATAIPTEAEFQAILDGVSF